MGNGVKGLGFRVYVVGCRVQGAGYRGKLVRRAAEEEADHGREELFGHVARGGVLACGLPEGHELGAELAREDAERHALVLRQPRQKPRLPRETTGYEPFDRWRERKQVTKPPTHPETTGYEVFDRVQRGTAHVVGVV